MADLLTLRCSRPPQSQKVHLMASIVDHGVVFNTQLGTEYSSNAYASICTLPDGRWLCSWRAARTKNATISQHALLSWSDDEGRTWSQPSEPFRVLPSIGQRPGVARVAAVTSLGKRSVLATIYWVDHSEPARPFFNEKTEGLLDSRIFHARSDDGGVTWSEPVLMNTSPFDCPTPITGPTLVLPDGRLACQFELNKHYEDTSPWRHKSVLMFSSDQGRTWPHHTICSEDPTNRIFYWDQRPTILADGSLYILFWTFDTQTSSYLNIHARRSTDGGATWSAYHDTGVPGQPAPVVPLTDNQLGMVYVDRMRAPMIKLRVSSDAGRSWPDSSEIVIQPPISDPTLTQNTSMQDAWDQMNKFTMGLPTTARTTNGDLLVAYYAGARCDESDIRWARVR